MNAMAQNLRTTRQIAAAFLCAAGESAHLRVIAGLCLFEAGFFIAFHYGMSFSHALASPFWFPDSVLLCALLLSPPRRWWLFIVAALPVRIFISAPFALPPWFVLATFAIDSAKGLVAASILRRFANPVRLETWREVTTFSVFIVLLIPAISAVFGAGARHHLLGHAYW